MINHLEILVRGQKYMTQDIFLFPNPKLTELWLTKEKQAGYPSCNVHARKFTMPSCLTYIQSTHVSIDDQNAHLYRTCYETLDKQS
jgi:hypothetical protein